jgi:signal transduction histidine kinase
MPKDEGFQPEPGKPALRRTVIRPAGAPIEACDAAHAANRLTTLAHELANLLDGSLRCLGIARRSAQEPRPAAPGDLSQRLDTVHAALVQMSDLVRVFSANLDGRIIGPTPGAQTRLFLEAGCASLSDAVRHAAEVMRPLAEERNIALKVDLDPRLDEVESCSMYRVVADAIRNSIEAIQRVRDNGGGSITVTGRIEGSARSGTVSLEIADDGVGPSLTPKDSGAYFDFGFTTKSGGSGIGLAIAKEVVTELGGIISLRARDDRSKSGRTGAVLHIAFPARHLDAVGTGGAGEGA